MTLFLVHHFIGKIIKFDLMIISEKVIAIERKKQSDATEKIAMLTESIKKLSK